MSDLDAPAWCSWCLKLTEQELVQENVVRRSVYCCSGCKGRTLRCKTEKCEAFAKGTKMWDEDYCAKCQNRITDWEGDSRVTKKAWCSWCLEHTQHKMVEKNTVFRDVYECELCAKLGLACRRCEIALARKHESWDDDQCAVCQKILAAWGEKFLSQDCRIKRWCSACVEETQHEIAEKNLLMPDVYDCGNCHAKTTICRSCEDGCAAVVAPIEVPADLPIPSTFGALTSAIPRPLGVDTTLCLRCQSRDETGEPTKTWASLKTSQEIAKMDDLREQVDAAAARLKEEELALLEKLCNASDTMTVRKNEVFIQQGVETKQLFLIMRGSVSVEKVDSAGKLIMKIASLGKGDCIGEVTFLKGGESTANVRCESDIALLATITPEALIRRIRMGEIQEGVFFRYLSLKLAHRIKMSNIRQRSGLPKLKTVEQLRKEEDEVIREGRKLFIQNFPMPNAEMPLLHEACTAVFRNRRPIYGTIFICKSVICVLGKIFGEEYQYLIHYGKISNLQQTGVAGLSFSTSIRDLESAVLEFSSEDTATTVLVTMQTCLQEPSQWQSQDLFTDLVPLPDESTGMKGLIRRSRVLKFAKDTTILHEGNTDQKIYQVMKGSVRVEKGTGLDLVVLAKLTAGTIFGETSYIEGSSAAANVVADCDDMEVCVLEGKFINDEFAKDPKVEGKFYSYVAELLAARLRVAMDK